MSNHRSDAFVLFGATGDLPGRKIYPALQALVPSGQLDMPVIGVALSGWALDILRQHICNSLELHGEVDAQAYAKLSSLLRYVHGHYRDTRAPSTGCTFCSAMRWRRCTTSPSRRACSQPSSRGSPSWARRKAHASSWRSRSAGTWPWPSF